MKRIFCVIMLMTAMTMQIWAESPLKGKTVLFVYGGWEGHDPVECKEIFVPWLRNEGAEVIEANQLSIYKEKSLMQRVDLIIQTWTMGTISGDEEAGLLEAVRNGTGLAGWHGGIGDAFRNSTEFQFMVGGQWVAHPGGSVDYDVTITNRKDDVTKGLKRQFHMKSEQYYMHVDPGVKVLATTRFNGEHASWIDGVEMPVVWKKMYGQGRVFYSSLGHNSADFSVPEALELMKRGMRWAVR